MSLATIGGSNGETPDGTWRGSTEWRGSIAGVRRVPQVLGFNCLRRLYHSHGVGLSSAPKSAVTVLVSGVGLVLAGILYQLRKIANRT